MDFTEKNGNLIITIDAEEREILRESGEDIHTDEYMYDFFGYFIANSGYDWILPVEFGDLTDAPMLCSEGNREHRFGYIYYQIDSVLGRLLETGTVTFTGE